MSRLYPIFPVDEAKAYEHDILGDDLTRTAAAMENAGRAIGSAILDDYREIREWPAAPRVLVLAGKGLNAGDAFIACQTLYASLSGLQVTLVASAAEADLNPLAADALRQLQQSMGEACVSLTVEEFRQAAAFPVDVVIDGLYGLGFRPPLQAEIAGLLKEVNARDGIGLRAAVDIPSGIGSDKSDPDAFRADFTYIPGVAKAPCFKREHAGAVGRIRFLEIEPFLDQPADGTHRFVASPKWYRKINHLRLAEADKRAYGHCLVLAGSSRMPGAAIMSTLGSVQTGAGLVTSLSPANICSHIAGSVPEAMWRPLPLTHDGGLDVESVRIVAQFAQKGSSLLIGPGMVMDRPTVFSVCRIIRETPLALVLDASALLQDVLSAVAGRALTSGPVVLTPHRGEYARLLGSKDDPDNEETLLSFSRKYRVVTVLKGSPTLICDGQRIISVPVGGPVLARGGSGDILSGMILTQLAQCMEDPLDAVLRAITWHGAAADSLARHKGSIAVRTTEILDHLAASLRS